MNNCLTVKEAAEYLQVHPMTARRMARDGVIPGRKVGKNWRFDPDQLRDYVCGEDPPEEKEWHLEEIQKLESGSETGTSTKSEYAALLARK